VGLTANKKVAFADFCVLQPEGSQAEGNQRAPGAPHATKSIQTNKKIILHIKKLCLIFF